MPLEVDTKVKGSGLKTFLQVTDLEKTYIIWTDTIPYLAIYTC